MTKKQMLVNPFAVKGKDVSEVIKKTPPTFTNVITGDYVYIEPNSGFGDAGTERVTDIITKYDEDTGKPYKVICFKNHKFDARDGYAVSPPYGYHLSHVVKNR